MPDQLQLRGGTTVQHSTFTGASKEVTVDTTKKTVVVHDGSTAGGNPMLREDASNSALALGSQGTPSLKFTGDPNTGIYSPGADQVAISTNGTGRLFISSTGQIGIGGAPSGGNLNIIDPVPTIRLTDSDTSGYSHVLQSDTSLYLDADRGAAGTGALIVRTNGTNERLRVTSAGLVGVGTSSPTNTAGFSQQLQLSGNLPCISIDNTGTGANKYSLGVNSVGALGIWDNTASAFRMYINSSGSVGIGTSSPSSLLHIEGTSGNAKIRLGTGGDHTLIGPDSSGHTIINAGTVGGNMQLQLAGTTKVTLNSTGLGIGTQSPVSPLNVSVADGGNITISNTSDNHTGGLAFGDTSSNTSGRISYDHFNNSMRFDTAGSERARIDSSGRWLLGTSTAPTVGVPASATFVVQGYAGVPTGDSLISLQRGQAPASISSGSQLGAITFGANDGSPYAQIHAATDAAGGTNDYPGRLVFSTTADGASSPTERMRIDRNGVIDKVVGVYNNTTAVAANLFIGSGGDFNRSTSSAKYKTQIEDIEDIYCDAILKCRPVWYRSTCKGDNPDHGWWGFIAEEVAEIDPRLVQWKTIESGYDQNGLLVQTPCEPEPEGVSYDRFVPHLLNLIKRQKEQIEAMEARLAALESA